MVHIYELRSPWFNGRSRRDLMFVAKPCLQKPTPSRRDAMLGSCNKPISSGSYHPKHIPTFQTITPRHSLPYFPIPLYLYTFIPLYLYTLIPLYLYTSSIPKYSTNTSASTPTNDSSQNFRGCSYRYRR